MCARTKEEHALREEKINRIKRKVGELAIDLEILPVAAKQRLRRRGRPTSDLRRCRACRRAECVECLAFPAPGCGRAPHWPRYHHGSMQHWPSAFSS